MSQEIVNANIEPLEKVAHWSSREAEIVEKLNEVIEFLSKHTFLTHEYDSD